MPNHPLVPLPAGPPLAPKPAAPGLPPEARAELRAAMESGEEGGAGRA